MIELGQLGVNDLAPLKKLVGSILHSAAERATTIEFSGVERVPGKLPPPPIPDRAKQNLRDLNQTALSKERLDKEVAKNTPTDEVRKLRPEMAAHMDEIREGLLDTHHEPARLLYVTFDGAEAMVCPASLTRGVFRVLARALGFEPEAWDGQPRDFSFTREDRSTKWRLIGFRFDNDPYAKIVRVETGP